MPISPISQVDTKTGSVAKILFLQFDTIIFTVMYHFLPNEND